MICVAGTRAGDPVAGRESLDAFAHRLHDSGARVAQGLRRIEAVDDCAVGGKRSLLTHLAQHLADEIGPAARLAEDRLAREVDRDLVGTRRDHGEVVLDQQLTGAGRRSGHVDELELAAARILEDLLQAEALCLESWESFTASSAPRSM